MAGSVGKSSTRFFEFINPENPLSLRVGGKLARFTLAYEMYGRMNASKSNVILLFHAMTGSQHAAGLNRNVPGLNGRWTEELHEGWWDAFIGPGKALDTRKFCVICANYLGGCYGSTGPASINPQTGKPWGPAFPVLRMVDIVESQLRLLDSLGVKKLRAVTGASIGGYLSLLLATRHPDRVRIVVPIGTSLETTIVTGSSTSNKSPPSRATPISKAAPITTAPGLMSGSPWPGASHTRRLCHPIHCASGPGAWSSAINPRTAGTK